MCNGSLYILQILSLKSSLKMTERRNCIGERLSNRDFLIICQTNIFSRCCCTNSMNIIHFLDHTNGHQYSHASFYLFDSIEMQITFRFFQTYFDIFALVDFGFVLLDIFGFSKGQTFYRTRFLFSFIWFYLVPRCFHGQAFDQY